jgi:hypothetical protein
MKHPFRGIAVALLFTAALFAGMCSLGGCGEENADECTPETEATSCPRERPHCGVCISQDPQCYLHGECSCFACVARNGQSCSC